MFFQFDWIWSTEWQPGVECLQNESSPFPHRALCLGSVFDGFSYVTSSRSFVFLSGFIFTSTPFFLSWSSTSTVLPEVEKISCCLKYLLPVNNISLSSSNSETASMGSNWRSLMKFNRLMLKHFRTTYLWQTDSFFTFLFFLLCDMLHSIRQRSNLLHFL